MAVDVPFFSIIVPTFNVEPFIEETLRSLFDLKGCTYEVLVIDDNSTDGTLAIVNALTANHPQFHVLQSNQNLGVAAARNLGIKECRGQWISFLDGDDIALSNFLSSRLEVIEKKDAVDFIASDFYLWWDSAQKLELASDNIPTWNTAISLFTGDLFFVDSPSRLFIDHTCIVQTGAATIRKDLLAKVGLFSTDLKTNEDTHLWHRAARRSELFAFVKSPNHLYRQRPHSLSNTDRGKHGDSPKMFLMLANDPLFEADKAHFKSRALSHSLQNTYYYRESGQRLRAIRSAFTALTISPIEAVVLKNLLASLLGLR
ncbi:glycosyltransferase family 2 protein [Congregibacter brevis]|uniref:Glycosyltransferase family 2 protein n=1 Tax=Congregibacter brevis TaxID=3081201 RepID=A0ABZ0IIF6_9GAMM|nr:glycosyltransferase family 2 protein [Congregibacter sp. IMCC45268]